MLDFLEALENYECALELLKNHGDEIMNISVFIMIIVLLVAIIITKKKNWRDFIFVMFLIIVMVALAYFWFCPI
ncbi:MAG: hypothetical protein HFJ45_05545 [Clostridia bacterium]|nr:hypothetical protein [Clostridia bacterium]